MKPEASIIITSYNYAQYLPECIDSALAQTGCRAEVIVVDDGSSDSSPSVIRSYGNRIKPVFKVNGGQASAFNAGFRSSSGEVVCFVDSDDMLFPQAMHHACELMKESGSVKVHWPLVFIDETGRPMGGAMHATDLDEGDLRALLVERGPAGYNWPSTSGNAWGRPVLESMLPIPEDRYPIGPDTYLSALVPLYGKVRKSAIPLGAYRKHLQNNTFRQPFRQRIAEALSRWECSFAALEERCKALGLIPRREEWPKYSWWHQLALAVSELTALLPASASIVLVDGGSWVVSHDLEGRRVFRFVEKNGVYYGPPRDSAHAIHELESLRAQGAEFLIFTREYFWVLEFNRVFEDYILGRFPCILKNERLAVFDLRSELVNAAKGEARKNWVS